MSQSGVPGGQSEILLNSMLPFFESRKNCAKTSACPCAMVFPLASSSWTVLKSSFWVNFTTGASYSSGTLPSVSFLNILTFSTAPANLPDTSANLPSRKTSCVNAISRLLPTTGLPSLSNMTLESRMSSFASRPLFMGPKRL